MEEEKQPSLEDWADFAGEWLKAEFIKEFPVKLICVGIEGVLDDGKSRLIVNIEYLGKKWKLDLNKTNQGALRSRKIMPKDVVGKTLVCEKIKVMNPSTNAQVDSLLITNVE